MKRSRRFQLIWDGSLGRSEGWEGTQKSFSGGPRKGASMGTGTQGCGGMNGLGKLTIPEIAGHLHDSDRDSALGRYTDLYMETRHKSVDSCHEAWVVTRSMPSYCPPLVEAKTPRRRCPGLLRQTKHLAACRVYSNQSRTQSSQRYSIRHHCCLF